MLILKLAPVEKSTPFAWRTALFWKFRLPLGSTILLKLLKGVPVPPPIELEPLPLPGSFIWGLPALPFMPVPFGVAPPGVDELAAESPSVDAPLAPIAFKFKPAAGPLRLAMPPPAPGSFKPPPPASPAPGPPMPGVEADREPIAAIGPADPTRPSAPPAMGEGRPGPLCPTSCGLFVLDEEEGDDVDADEEDGELDD